jgi:hypothetical protein
LRTVFGVGEDLVHRLVELVDRNRVPSHTKNTVELSSHEGKTGFFGSTSESLGLVGTPSFRWSRSKANDVGVDGTLHGAGTILDLEGFTSGGASGGFLAVVLRMEITSQVGSRAPMARNPEVGRSGIEQDAERLWRVSNRDVSIILSILEIVKTFVVRKFAWFVALDVFGFEVFTSNAILVFFG